MINGVFDEFWKITHLSFKQSEYYNNNYWLVCVWVSEFNSLVAGMYWFCFGCLQNIVRPGYNYAKSALQHLNR